jgi:hypothetical protein
MGDRIHEGTKNILYFFKISIRRKKSLMKRIKNLKYQQQKILKRKRKLGKRMD